MPAKDRDKTNRPPDPSESASDRIPVESAPERNAGIDADRQHHPGGEYEGLSSEDTAEAPPYAQPGVGGRTSPRSEDDPWTPAEGTPEMGGGPAATFGSVATPDMHVDEPPVAIGSVPYTEDARDMYVDRMKANLDERGIEIQSLMSQVGGVEGTLRSQYQQQLENIRSLQESASKALQLLMQSGGSAWSTMTGTVDKAYEELKSAVDSAMSRFR